MQPGCGPWLMLRLARNLLSRRRGPSRHNPSDDICISFPFCPKAAHTKQLLVFLRRGGGGRRERGSDLDFKTSAADNGQRLLGMCLALEAFSPLLGENRWVVSPTVWFIGNGRKPAGGGGRVGEREVPVFHVPCHGGPLTERDHTHCILLHSFPLTGSPKIHFNREENPPASRLMVADLDPGSLGWAV